ncbi:GGDEF domain-containing protein [Candidatus Gracilibacteria bacterium]|nr:GGDEF domain-containing protein [Candidatus Gracilibacteria bacterium]MCF7855958.1 GGDEF domain-containing protein [Candidatus Gracilibacteria bacterium]MCF7896349.1 GGDEF domain-containing protein [Candidatus Gracilibacteria bacterium]
MHKLYLVESRVEDFGGNQVASRGVGPEEKEYLIRGAEDVSDFLEEEPLDLGKDLEKFPKRLRKRIRELLEKYITPSSEIEDLVAESLRANEELNKIAMIDTLTEVGNRRFLGRQLEQEFARAERTEKPLSIIFIDLDHFKEVNDTKGHGVGDRVLQDVAKLFKGIIRGQDTISRYGGDEFTILLPATDIEGATKLAEKLRKGVEDNMLEEYGVTASIGVTDSIQIESLKGKTNSEFLKELQKLADEALYAAKKGGRNQVSMFSSF